jgi:hypothetical protein
MQNQKKPKKPKPTIPLMELLAYNSTGPARMLLKKYGKEDATGYANLEEKLSNLYYESKDKIEIEKQFAQIHPHRDFILKYLSPPEVKTNVIVKEPLSACDGCGGDCGKKSNAEGDQTVLTPRVNTDFLIASVAIVGIVGLVIYSTRK